MTNALELWLSQATRHLSHNSAAQVRTEIQEHYDSAFDAARAGGATADDADRIALTALGDAREANRQYRKVLLTSSEARLLGESGWESRTVCARRLSKSVLLSVPAVVLLASIVLFRFGSPEIARVLLAASIGMSLLFLMPLLPIYTESRSRIARYFRWILLFGGPVLIFGADALKFSWMLITIFWPIISVEWTRISIRRKLPVAQWPRHLYL
jgi:hypothetical protein